MKNLFRKISLFSLLLCFPLSGLELVPDRDGRIKIGPASLEVRCFSRKWSTPRGNLKQQRSGSKITLSGKQSLMAEPLLFTESVTAIGKNKFKFHASVQLEKPQEIPFFGVALVLPVDNGAYDVTVDGKPYPLPEKYSKKAIPGVRNARKIVLNLTGGTRLTLEGTFNLSAQDNRRFPNGNSMELRLTGKPASGVLQSAAIDLDMTVETLKCQPLDISKVANMGFADDEPDNGKGGWNDQGSGNDLSSFKASRVEVENVFFNIIDPARNNGKSSIVMGRTVDPSPVTLKLPAGSRGRSLVFLHATCWTPASKLPLGYIHVTFADGSRQKITVSMQDDSGNWHNPMPRKNAAVAWEGVNQHAKLGLYAAPFALRRNDPVSIKLELNRIPRHKNAMWMIAGITLADRPFRFTNPEREYVVAANKEWRPLDFRRNIVPGSPLDFSRFIEAPAGKYGRVISRPDGTLSFEKAPEKRIRFLGTNLAFSANYLTKQEADELALALRRTGLNSVRIHHYDTELLDKNADNSTTFDPAKLDQLDYLIHTMAKNGIYVTIDLYCSRIFKPGDNIPECKQYGVSAMKPLLPVSRAAMENWKTFVKKLLEHRNPYTGNEWRNEPALWLYNLVNEEVLEACYASVGMKGVYDEKYQEWLQKKGYSANQHRLAQFFNELQGKVLDEQLDYLKNTLKVNGMLTSLNHREFVRLTELRHKFEIVDNHSYHDHPNFPIRAWAHPVVYSQLSAMQGMAKLPRELLPTRIFGKPFVVTEFNYINPNRFRAEGGPLMGAYAALQNWDGLYRFAWAHSRAGATTLRAPTLFDESNDPLMQLSDRIIFMLFNRGNVLPAKEKYAYDIPENIFEGTSPLYFPQMFSELGLIAQIGSVFGKNPVPAGVQRIPAADAAKLSALKNPALAALWRKAQQERIAVSSTGQLVLNGKKQTFTVKTPHVESVTLEKGDLTADFLQVKNASGFQTVAVIALDEKPLRQSRNILLLQLTDLANTGAKYGSEGKTLCNYNGTLPILLRRGSAEIRLDVKRNFKVTALRSDGAEAGDVPGNIRDGKFVFKADTAAFPCGIMALHLTAK